MLILQKKAFFYGFLFFINDILINFGQINNKND